MEVLFAQLRLPGQTSESEIRRKYNCGLSERDFAAYLTFARFVSDDETDVSCYLPRLKRAAGGLNSGFWTNVHWVHLIMCGIVGIVRSDNHSVDQALVSRMCSAIRHRGPDDDGFYFTERVGLGMRRLSIIDVAGDQQPIHNQDRSAWIVFNGEIYS